jgi:iron complex transport system substrate-binding protein
MRIVTLGGAITETVYALGAGGLVVARDASSLYPEEATRLPDVGYFRTIGAEGVLAQNPTLVLAVRGTGPASQVELLEKSGIRFVHLDARPSAESTLDMIARTGELLGRRKEAEALSGKLRGELARVRSRTERAGGAGEAGGAGRKPSVIFILGMGAGSVSAAGRGTAADALITLAGGRNVFDDMQNYKSVNAETLLARAPDIILVGAPDAAAHRPPDWLREMRAGTGAGGGGRVYPLNLGYHLVFGPRLGEAVDEVSRLFFPEQAAE